MSISILKIIFIPVLTLGAGFFMSLDNQDKKRASNDYPEHLTGSFTGGFGEQSCHSCHFDYDLNWEEGRLTVEGIPGQITPGKTYEIKIAVEREDLGKAGFQLSTRFFDGQQAGRFEISENERLMFTREVPDSLQYIQHSNKGTEPVEEGINRWKVKWVSPESITDSIFFNIAANAANGDQSEFGDWIYVRENRILIR